MRQNVRFIVLTGDEGFAEEMRAVLRRCKGAKIVAEVEEPALIERALKQLPAEVLLVDLDPSPEAVLPILSELTHQHSHLAVFAASKSTDGPLILKAMRTGIKEFLPKPIDQAALKDAVDRIVSAQPRSSDCGSLISVVGTSGGIGATLLTTSLAVELSAIAGGDVVAVDLDHRFGQVATLLDVEPTHSLADLCSSPEQLEPQVVERALAKHSSGTRVLSRPLTLPEADTISAASAVGVFSQLLQLHEYVVADGPTRFDVGWKSILAMADVTLIVVQPIVPCIRNAMRMLENMRENGISLDRVRLVCNRVGATSGHLSVKDISATLGMEVFASIPDEWATASGAINLGEPLMTSSPKSKLRLAIQEIAHRLHSPNGDADEKGAPKQGLIGRIFASG